MRSFIPGARRRAQAQEAVRRELTDEQAQKTPAFFNEWKVAAYYALGGRVQYKSVLYRCLLTHVSQGDWNPEAASSLWVRIASPEEEWPEWRQPLGSQDAYKINDKVKHAQKRWVSEVNNNVWEPGIHGWKESDMLK